MEEAAFDSRLAQRLRDIYRLPGQPVTISEFAKLMRERRQAPGSIRDFIESVKAGKAVIGECGEEHGYSLVLSGGKAVKVMCAYDALMTSVLRGSGLVKAACPHCCEAMQISIREKKVADSSSSEILFWWGTGPKGEPGNPVCDHLHLFPSRGHLSGWLTTRSEELGFSISLGGIVSLLGEFD